MKYFIGLILSVSIAFNSYAQITPEHEYDVPGLQFTIVNLEVDGMKYCTYEFSDEYKDLWMLLYNLDHTKFLELNFDLSKYLVNYDNWTGNVYYITENVFDQDIEIEVLLEIDVVLADENIHYILVFNENGELMFELSNAYVLWAEVYGDMPKGIFITPDGPKMILDVFDGNQWLYKVYALGGNVTSAKMAEYLEPLPTAYPNPAKDFVRIPLHEETFIVSVKLFNLEGKLIEEQMINQQARNVVVNTLHLSAATYLYVLNAKNKAGMSGKFVVRK
jgi:hypothetical protein